MAFATVNGQTLYYEDGGDNGPAIVFSHGLLMDQEMFEPQVQALCNRYRCITWDQRAHGQTADDSIEAFSYYDSADDLAALLQQLGVDQAVLVGMSQGGYLSLRCALTHPSIVRALVLIDTQAQREDPEKTGSYHQMIDIWTAQGLPDEIADTIARIILGRASAGTADYWQDKWRRWQPHNLRAALETLVGRDDISDAIARIDVPALVIHGEADEAITLDRARDMAERLPNSKFVTVPGAGHAANLTRPEPVNAAIARFLDGLAY